jgi:hypothetical protein
LKTNDEALMMPLDTGSTGIDDRHCEVQEDEESDTSSIAESELGEGVVSDEPAPPGTERESAFQQRDDLLLSFQGLLRSIFLRGRVPDHFPSSRLPIFRLIVHGCLHPVTKFIGPREICRRLGRLKRFVRIAAIVDIHMEEDPEAIYEWVSESHNNPFLVICQELRMARGHVHSNPRPPLFTWTEGSGYRSLKLNTQSFATITIDSLKIAVARMQEEAKRILEDELFFQGRMKIVDLRNLKDDLQNTNVDYNFVKELKATNDSVDEYLFNRVTSEPTLIHRFFQDQRLVTAEARKYLATACSFQELLMSLVHLTSGQPARASELSISSLRNLTTGKQRSITVVKETVMVQETYNKSRSKIGSDRTVCRFLDQRTATLLVNYIVFVRPLETWLFTAVNASLDQEETGAKVYRDFLWVRNGKVVSDDRLRSAFKTNMFKFANIDISWGLYRHCAIGFMTKLVMFKTSPNLLPFHEQASHTKETAEISYAISNETSTAVGNTALESFFICSKQWHELLGLAVAAQPPSDTPKEPALEIIRPAILVDALIKRLYQDESADFKSKEQRVLLEAVNSKSTHVLGILPTGAGKSISFFAPCMGSSAKMSVVVCPLRGLLSDIEMRASHFGISYMTVKNADELGDFMAFIFHEQTPVRLLIVGIEMACHEGFVSRIRRLSYAGLVDRVVLDEAHLLVTHHKFRQTMSSFVREYSQLPIQLVCLSATVPFKLEVFFTKVLFSDFCWTIIRGPMARANLRFAMMPTGSYDQSLQRLWQFVSFRKVLESSNRKTIVFCREVDLARRVRAFLRFQSGYGSREIQDDAGCCLGTIVLFHGQLDAENKERVLRAFKSGIASICVATSGFGAGIDCPEVRNVVHIGLPHSTVDFAQEVGRAGRDGLLSYCLTIWDQDDLIVTEDKLLAILISELPRLTTPFCDDTLAQFGGCEGLWAYLDGRWRPNDDGLTSQIRQLECLVGDGQTIQGTSHGAEERSTQGAPITAAAAGASPLTRATAPPAQVTSHVPGLNISSGASAKSRHHGMNADFWTRMKDALDGVRDWCLKCCQKGQHDRCPESARRCLRCFHPGHGVGSCTMPQRVFKICFKCRMPLDIGSYKTHPGNSIGNKCPWVTLEPYLLVCKLFWDFKGAAAFQSGNQDKDTGAFRRYMERLKRDRLFRVECFEGWQTIADSKGLWEWMSRPVQPNAVGGTSNSLVWMHVFLKWADERV